MEKTIKKMVKTGYGLGLLSLQEGKKVAQHLKNDLNLNDKESVRLAQELVRTSVKTSREVLGAVQKNVEAALVRSKVVNKAELSLLKRGVKHRLGRLRKVEESGWTKIKRKVMRK